MARGDALSSDEVRAMLDELLRRVGALSDRHLGGDRRHVERMARTCVLLGRHMGLDESRCELLRLATPLHDVGKIDLPEDILRKSGPLTAADRKAIERHTEIGYSLLGGSSSEALELAATIALTHHERWDGRGYPRGLAREEIPLEGRIAAGADVFDALTSDRPFRPAFGSEAALRMMQEGRGTLFDPLVVDALADCVDEIATIEDALDIVRPPARRLDRERRWRRRGGLAQGTRTDAIPIDVLAHAVNEAIADLGAAGHAHHAVDGALATLCDVVGPDLLASLYVLEHDRLWLVAQRGYDQVRDGFRLDQGVMARAVSTAAIQLVPDVMADADFIAATRDLRSELALPLNDGLGVLNLETRRLRLDESHVPLAEMLAGAISKRAALMRGALGFDVASLARLFVYASSLRGTATIAEFATRTLARLLGLESAQLSLGSHETGFALASFWRRPDSVVQPLSSAHVERIARTARTGDAAYATLDLEEIDVELVREGQRWLVWLPLEVGGDRIGALVGSATRPLAAEPEHLEAATLFAPHAAALIDVAQTLRRERRAAVTDSLTGLLNRRGFEQRFREEIERAERGSHDLAVVILDCDGLKEINDRGGHELGDSVLLHVARCLRTRKRTADIAARLGGDEFALLLPEIDEERGHVAAERLRLALVDDVLEQGQLVTATFGIAAYPADGQTSSDLLRAADQALYVAKHTGRNRTELYSRAVRASDPQA